MDTEIIIETIKGMDLDRQVHFFDGLREKSYRLAEEIIAYALHLTGGGQVRLTGIGKEARAAWEKQWMPLFSQDKYYSDRYFRDDWSRYVPVYEQQNGSGQRKIVYAPALYCPGRFEAAIWHGDVLCALSLGLYENDLKRGFVSSWVGEGSPDPAHPLKKKVKEIALIAASAYGKILGVDEVLHVGPFSDGAKKQARRLGFSFDQRELYKDVWFDVISVPVRRVINIQNRYVLKPEAIAPA